MRPGILLGHFLCDRVQGVERFSAHSRHFPSQVPPGGNETNEIPDDNARIRKSLVSTANHFSTIVL